MAVPLIAAAAPVVGDIIGGLIGSGGQEDTNKTNMEIAQRQMDFQERMSDTAWQRGVADMEKAGINPMAQFAQPASSPGGAAIAAQNPKAALGQGVADAGGAILPAVQALKQMQLTDAQTGAAISSARQADANANKANADAGYTNFQLRRDSYGPIGDNEVVPYSFTRDKAQLSLLQQQIRNASTQNQLMRAGMPAAGVVGSKLGGWSRLLFGGAGGAAGISRFMSAIPEF